MYNNIVSKYKFNYKCFIMIIEKKYNDLKINNKNLFLLLIFYQKNKLLN